jgi:hypothetical protein
MPSRVIFGFFSSGVLVIFVSVKYLWRRNNALGLLFCLPLKLTHLGSFEKKHTCIRGAIKLNVSIIKTINRNAQQS